jgi:hypothetical protein
MHHNIRRSLHLRSTAPMITSQGRKGSDNGKILVEVNGTPQVGLEPTTLRLITEKAKRTVRFRVQRIGSRDRPHRGEAHQIFAGAILLAGVYKPADLLSKEIFGRRV